MGKENYEAKLQWYRNYIKDHEQSNSRRTQGYVDYLKRWFSNDVKCDGMFFTQKYQNKVLPMPYLIYFS